MCLTKGYMYCKYIVGQFKRFTYQTTDMNRLCPILCKFLKGASDETTVTCWWSSRRKKCEVTAPAM